MSSDPTQAAFAALKPVCLQVMRLADALLRGQPVADAAPLRALRGVLRACPRAGLPRCIDYVLMPLLLLLPSMSWADTQAALRQAVATGVPPPPALPRCGDLVVEEALAAVAELLAAAGWDAFVTHGAGASAGANGNDDPASVRVRDLLRVVGAVLGDAEAAASLGGGSSSGSRAGGAEPPGWHCPTEEMVGTALELLCLLCEGDAASGAAGSAVTLAAAGAARGQQRDADSSAGIGDAVSARLDALASALLSDAPSDAGSVDSAVAAGGEGKVVGPACSPPPSSAAYWTGLVWWGKGREEATGQLQQHDHSAVDWEAWAPLNLCTPRGVVTFLSPLACIVRGGVVGAGGWCPLPPALGKARRLRLAAMRALVAVAGVVTTGRRRRHTTPVTAEGSGGVGGSCLLPPLPEAAACNRCPYYSSEEDDTTPVLAWQRGWQVWQATTSTTAPSSSALPQSLAARRASLLRPFLPGVLSALAGVVLGTGAGHTMTLQPTASEVGAALSAVAALWVVAVAPTAAPAPSSSGAAALPPATETPDAWLAGAGAHVSALASRLLAKVAARYLCPALTLLASSSSSSPPSFFGVSAATPAGLPAPVLGGTLDLLAALLTSGGASETGAVAPAGCVCTPPLPLPPLGLGQHYRPVPSTSSSSPSTLALDPTALEAALDVALLMAVLWGGAEEGAGGAGSTAPAAASSPPCRLLAGVLRLWGAAPTLLTALVRDRAASLLLALATPRPALVAAAEGVGTWAAGGEAAAGAEADVAASGRGWVAAGTEDDDDDEEEGEEGERRVWGGGWRAAICQWTGQPEEEAGAGEGGNAAVAVCVSSSGGITTASDASSPLLLSPSWALLRPSLLGMAARGEGAFSGPLHTGSLAAAQAAVLPLVAVLVGYLDVLPALASASGTSPTVSAVVAAGLRGAVATVGEVAAAVCGFSPFSPSSGASSSSSSGGGSVQGVSWRAESSGLWLRTGVEGGGGEGGAVTALSLSPTPGLHTWRGLVQLLAAVTRTLSALSPLPSSSLPCPETAPALTSVLGPLVGKVLGPGLAADAVVLLAGANAAVLPQTLGPSKNDATNGATALAAALAHAGMVARLGPGVLAPSSLPHPARPRLGALACFAQALAAAATGVELPAEQQQLPVNDDGSGKGEEEAASPPLLWPLASTAAAVAVATLQQMRWYGTTAAALLMAVQRAAAGAGGATTTGGAAWGRAAAKAASGGGGGSGSTSLLLLAPPANSGATPSLQLALTACALGNGLRAHHSYQQQSSGDGLGSALYAPLLPAVLAASDALAVEVAASNRSAAASSPVVAALRQAAAALWECLQVPSSVSSRGSGEQAAAAATGAAAALLQAAEAAVVTAVTQQLQKETAPAPSSPSSLFAAAVEAVCGGGRRSSSGCVSPVEAAGRAIVALAVAAAVSVAPAPVGGLDTRPRDAVITACLEGVAAQAASSSHEGERGADALSLVAGKRGRHLTAQPLLPLPLLLSLPSTCVGVLSAAVAGWVRAVSQALGALALPLLGGGGSTGLAAGLTRLALLATPPGGLFSSGSAAAAALALLPHTSASSRRRGDEGRGGEWLPPPALAALSAAARAALRALDDAGKDAAWVGMLPLPAPLTMAGPSSSVTDTASAPPPPASAAARRVWLSRWGGGAGSGRAQLPPSPPASASAAGALVSSAASTSVALASPSASLSPLLLPPRFVPALTDAAVEALAAASSSSSSSPSVSTASTASVPWSNALTATFTALQAVVAGAGGGAAAAADLGERLTVVLAATAAPLTLTASTSGGRLVVLPPSAGAVPSSSSSREGEGGALAAFLRSGGDAEDAGTEALEADARAAVEQAVAVRIASGGSGTAGGVATASPPTTWETAAFLVALETAVRVLAADAGRWLPVVALWDASAAPGGGSLFSPGDTAGRRSGETGVTGASALPPALAAAARRLAELRALAAVTAASDETVSQGSQPASAAVSPQSNTQGLLPGGSSGATPALAELAASAASTLPWLPPTPRATIEKAVRTAACYTAAAAAACDAAAAGASAAASSASTSVLAPLALGVAALRAMRAGCVALARHPDTLFPLLHDVWPSVAVLLPPVDLVWLAAEGDQPAGLARAGEAAKARRSGISSSTCSGAISATAAARDFMMRQLRAAGGAGTTAGDGFALLEDDGGWGSSEPLETPGRGPLPLAQVAVYDEALGFLECLVRPPRLEEDGSYLPGAAALDFLRHRLAPELAPALKQLAAVIPAAGVHAVYRHTREAAQRTLALLASPLVPYFEREALDSGGGGEGADASPLGLLAEAREKQAVPAHSRLFVRRK